MEQKLQMLSLSQVFHEADFTCIEFWAKKLSDDRFSVLAQNIHFTIRSRIFVSQIVWFQIVLLI